MRFERLLRNLESRYHALARAAELAETNLVRKDLPLRLQGPGDVLFLPASSLAIQSLIPVSIDAHAGFDEVAAAYRSHCPDVARKAFWQPRGTFHLNVAILQRLSLGRAASRRHPQLVRRASGVCDWLDRQRPYHVQFNGVFVAPDGTILARGYPASAHPWLIRRRFEATGFKDQQQMFHVTIGRILDVLPPDCWKGVLKFTRERFGRRDLGSVEVKHAVLVTEREGFLHTRSCFRVIRQCRFKG